MSKLKAEQIIEQYADSVVELGMARSVQSLGSESYPFALGYVQSDLKILLDDLNLTQKQLKILADRVL